MQATRFEFHFRLWIHVILYALGFGLVPLLDRFTPGILEALSITTKSTWLVATSLIARQHLLTFATASIVLLLLAALLTGLGAWLRLWGAAYTSAAIVPSSATQGEPFLADGPYRRTRNPLYLGTLLHTFGIAILMPPAGAAFSVSLLWIFQFRLALAEESLMAAKLGQPYLDYKAAVPRFLPAPSPQVPSAGAQPHWLRALLGELYFVGVFLTLLCFGWSFNATPLYRGILISLGASIIARAFLPPPAASALKAKVRSVAAARKPDQR